MNLNLPKYRCYKVVGAIRISKVEFGDTGATVLGDGHAVEVDQAFLDKHGPKEGQYLVQYDDGYLSISPAQAFEMGYTVV